MSGESVITKLKDTSDELCSSHNLTKEHVIKLRFKKYS